MNTPQQAEWARWPPKPAPTGRDLNPWLAVLLVPLVPIVFYAAELQWKTAHGVAGWRYDPTVPVILRQTAPRLVELALILIAIGWLGWWAATGVRRTDVRIPYRWSVVPVAVFAALTLAVCASPEVAQLGLGVVGASMASIFVGALTEELLFRGIGLHALSRAWGGVAGVLVTSVLFVLIHAPGRLDAFAHDPVIMPLQYFAFGVFMCRVRVAAGSIWWPTAIHTLWNFSVYGSWWGALDWGFGLSAVYLVWDLVGLALALVLPASERFASSSLFFQFRRWRIPADLRVPYHRKLLAQLLMSPKPQGRWSAVIRGRVIGGVPQPIEEQKSSVGS